MFDPTADDLELLKVRLDAFATCEIGEGCGLRFPPCEKIVIHYVLQGEGAIECEHGTFPLRAGSIAVIPKKLRKRINGRGPVVTVTDADNSCPVVPGIVKVRACQSDAGGLVLGCAWVSPCVGEGRGLFDHLQEPFIEGAEHETLPLLFDGILSELSSPGMATKSIVEAIMTQILVLLLRSHLKRSGLASPLYHPLLNHQIDRAIMAMIANPKGPHCVSSLAKVAGMSRSRFTHYFTKTCGTSPIAHLQSVRLRRAARLLRSSTDPVKSVAAAVGFASRSHFSMLFREEFGLDPTAFRQRALFGADRERRADTSRYRQSSEDRSGDMQKKQSRKKSRR